MHKLYPLFRNKYQTKLTRAGITYILKKHVEISRKKHPELFPNVVSPHCLRQSDVNLIYIRDLLGHVSIETTEIYAKTDSEMKRKALEKAAQKIIPSQQPKCHNNRDLLCWLKDLGK